MNLLRPLSIALGLACLATPAMACLPPPQGGPEPIWEDQLKGVVERAPNIVYGVVEEGGSSSVRFRVIHVYKGNVKPGAMLQLRVGFVVGPHVPCGLAGPPPPMDKGLYGVAAFNPAYAELNLFDPRDMDTIFNAGWLRRANP